MPLENISSDSISIAIPLVNEIKIWHQGHKQIAVVEANNSIRFNVMHCGTTVQIPAYGVSGIPTGISLAGLKRFLEDTWVQLHSIGEGKYTLDIHQRLRGGGHTVNNSDRLWPHGIVPYEIDIKKYPFGSDNRRIILQALQAWESSQSGLKFVPRINEKDVLVFSEILETDRTDVGRHGGAQYAQIDADEFTQVNVMRAIGHAIGLYNEHTRPDRDQYITLTPDSVLPEITSEESVKYGRYDFASIMHYPLDTLLKNHQCIISKIEFPRIAEVGLIATLSSGDIAAIKSLYPIEKNISSRQPSLEAVYSAKFDPTIAPIPQRAAAAAAAPEAGEESDTDSITTPRTVRTPEWETILNIGDKAYKVKNLKIAYDYFRTLVEEYGQYMPQILANLYYRCGLCQYHSGEYDSAISWHKLALQIEPENAVFHHECGICYYRLEDYESADIYYAKAMALALNNKEIEKSYKQNQTKLQTKRQEKLLRKGSVNSILSASHWKVFKKTA